VESPKFEKMKAEETPWGHYRELTRGLCPDEPCGLTFRRLFSGQIGGCDDKGCRRRCSHPKEP